MSTVEVYVRRVPHAADSIETDLARARVLARLMDSRFEIGGIKFGLDALIGLVPGVGDVISTLAGLYPMYLARKHNLPRRVMARMAANIALDFVGGVIPVVGDIFDVAFRSNLKNLGLLERAASRARVQSRE